MGNEMIQRLLDIIFSGLAILCLALVLLPLIIVLSLTGEGEVFYRQPRVGLDGRFFELLKFATMLKDSPNIGPGEITILNDSRILPLGKFLRKSKINELPQLWNIFIGDMSIVGPRPMVPKTFEHYPEHSKGKICSIRPGLTGVGSIIFRDEERCLDGLSDPVSFYRQTIIPYKSSLELWYVERQSTALYFKVIFITAWVVLFPSSRLPQTIFLGLPLQPKELQRLLHVQL